MLYDEFDARNISFSDDINKYQAAVLKCQEDVKRLLDEQQKVENIEN